MIPSFLHYLRSYNVGSCCYSASYKQNGDILIGTQGGLKIFDKDIASVHSYDTPHRTVNSVVANLTNNFILHRQGNVCKVDITLADRVDMYHQLFEFDSNSTVAAHITVSEKVIAVKHPDTNKLLTYNIARKSTTAIQPEMDMLKIHLTSDEHILSTIRTSRNLIKYSLEGDHLRPVWSCAGVLGNEICTDNAGLIYVRTDSGRNSMYVISPDGE